MLPAIILEIDHNRDQKSEHSVINEILPMSNTIIQVHLIHFSKPEEPKQYTLTLKEEVALKQISEFLCTQWKIIGTNKAIYSSSQTNPKPIDDTTIIRDLAGGKNSITLFVTQQVVVKQIPENKCCLIF